MRYALGVLGVVLVAFLAIFLITSHSSNTSSGTANTPKKVSGINVLDYDHAGSEVKVTVEGPLVGEDKRQSLRVTVSQNQRTIELLSGYEYSVARTESFSNTPAAYSTFLHALNNALFTKARKGITDDERGTCPTGNRYVYEITDGSNQVQRLWSASCSSSEGTFSGNGPLIRQLFDNQIPDYEQFISDTRVFD